MAAKNIEDVKNILDSLSPEQREQLVAKIDEASKSVPSWVWGLLLVLGGGGTGLFAFACKAICGCDTP